MNFYKHHIGDYDADTAHLSWLEDAAYRRLISLYYRREASIPPDLKDACRLVRAASKQERDAVEAVLGEFFDLQADGWHHKRCDAEIAEATKKAEVNRANGKGGGRPKKVGSVPQPSKNPEKTQTVSAAEQSGNLSQTPDTRHSDAGASGASAPLDTADVIFGLGVPLLTAAGVSERNARSMLGMFRKQHGDAAVIEVLQRCAAEKPMQPVPWLQTALKAKPPAGRTSAVDRQTATMNALTGKDRHHDRAPAGDVVDVAARVVA